jgi:superoxide dismutase, Fe-Mn family
MATLKTLVDDIDAAKSLDAIVNTSSGAVFNNAAQIWNHTFFWQSMKPQGGGAPNETELRALLDRDFGGWDKFCEAFKQQGVQCFGSAWVWLVLDGGVGKIITTPNAETPLTTAQRPLICCDVWEHAYYIDHRNKRDNFLATFCDRLVNWDFAAKNLKA